MAFTKYKELKYDTAGIPDANLTDYAKLFIISGDTDISAECSSGGGILVKDAAGSSTLPIELIDSLTDLTSGDVAFWVKVDLSTGASVGDVICRLYYSGSDSTTEDINNVWDANFVEVLHLEEDPSGSDFLDSTSNGNDITPSGLVSGDSVAALIGQGIDVSDSGDYAEAVGTNLPTGATDRFTIEGWHNSASVVNGSVLFGFGSNFTFAGSDNGKNRVMLIFNGHYYWWGRSADWDTGISLIADSAWHHWAVTSDGSNLRFYRDGVLEAGPQSLPSYATAGTTIRLAANPGGSNPDSVVDDCRISDTDRSADELAYRYVDGFDNASTFTLGTEQGGGGGGVTIPALDQGMLTGGLSTLCGGLI